MTHGPYTKAKQRYLIAERDDLRALNAQLLGALEKWVAHIQRWHQDGDMGGGRRCTDCVCQERDAQTVIKKAKGDPS